MQLYRVLAVAGLAGILLASQGCYGAFFHHVTVPLDVNMDATPAHTGERGTSQKRVVIPYPFRMQFDWGSSAVGDGMRSANITTVHYADLETISFLGVWTQSWIHIYGE
jgi:hypothetical protein